MPFFKADFFKTVIQRMCTLKVQYLGPGVRYTVHVSVIFPLFESVIKWFCQIVEKSLVLACGITYLT